MATKESVSVPAKMAPKISIKKQDGCTPRLLIFFRRLLVLVNFVRLRSRIAFRIRFIDIVWFFSLAFRER